MKGVHKCWLKNGGKAMYSENTLKRVRTKKTTHVTTMIEIFETCQTKPIAKQTNMDESLFIRSIVTTRAADEPKILPRPPGAYREI